MTPMHARLPRLRHAALAVGLALGGLAMNAPAQAPQAVATVPADGTLLTIAAQAEVRRVPDIATVSAGVVTQAADANAALRENAAQMAKVAAAVRAAGIAARDVQTAGVNLSPQYRYAENQPPVIIGYQASNTVNVVVRDIARLGRTLDALVASGANQVNGPSFDIDRKDEAQDQARRDALAKARERAAMYAQSLGLQVRRIVSIDETGGQGMPPPMIRMEAKTMAADAPETSISPGENVVGVTLNVVFELGR